MIWRMPVAFLCLGLLTILLTVFACCGMATEYGMSSLIYFLMIIILICLEISLGAYWVNIQPQYPTTSTSSLLNSSTSLGPNNTYSIPPSVSPNRILWVSLDGSWVDQNDTIIRTNVTDLYRTETDTTKQAEAAESMPEPPSPLIMIKSSPEWKSVQLEVNNRLNGQL